MQPLLLHCPNQPIGPPSNWKEYTNNFKIIQSHATCAQEEKHLLSRVSSDIIFWYFLQLLGAINGNQLHVSHCFTFRSSSDGRSWCTATASRQSQALTQFQCCKQVIHDSFCRKLRQIAMRLSIKNGQAVHVANMYLKLHVLICASNNKQSRHAQHSSRYMRAFLNVLAS